MFFSHQNLRLEASIYMIPDLLTLSLNLIILQWFSLCLKHFEKYVISKRYITARKNDN